jgi:putative transposase
VVVMLYIRLPLSLRIVEDLLHERDIGIGHETVRSCRNSFGPMSPPKSGEDAST